MDAETAAARHELRIRLYELRYERGLDIRTGQPLKWQARKEWESVMKKHNSA